MFYLHKLCPFIEIYWTTKETTRKYITLFCVLFLPLKTITINIQAQKNAFQTLYLLISSPLCYVYFDWFYGALFNDWGLTRKLELEHRRHLVHHPGNTTQRSIKHNIVVLQIQLEDKITAKFKFKT